MYIVASTLDDLLRRVLEKLLKSESLVKNASRGSNREILGALLGIKNPRARLSRTESKGTVFSCLGELFWYLSQRNDLGFISYYLPRYENESDDGKTIYGGYGPRLFDMRGNHQISNVVSLLRQKPDSRRAVIQLFNAEDIAADHKDIPCTCTLQFFLRNGRLHMFTTMRSNDAYIGLPHDVFAFTMIQEIMARTLGAELGHYRHAVGSLHLYERDRKRAAAYVGEGWQATRSVGMPAMPIGDPWPSIQRLLQAEAKIRAGEQVQITEFNLDPYWSDLACLLQIFSSDKRDQLEAAEHASKAIKSGIYNIYIEKRKSRIRTPKQPKPKRRFEK